MRLNWIRRCFQNGLNTFTRSWTLQQFWSYSLLLAFLNISPYEIINLQSYIKITVEKLEILRSTVPWKTLIQPSGTPASWASFIINMGANGFLGEGLITMVLPQTNAMGNICEQIKAKRLNRTNKSCHILQNILERQKKLYKICTFELCNTDAALQR